MMENIFEQYESKVRSYCRSFPTVFDRAKGSIMYDVNGKEYIDFFCGAGTMNYGHNNDFIKDRLIEYLQKDGLLHGLDMMTVPKAEFIKYFEEMILKPRGFDYKIMFPGPTGTNAVEAALKLARKVTKRTEVWALMGAFHGMTLGSVALTSDSASRAGAGVPLNHVTHIPAPYMFPELDTIKYMRKLCEDDHSAASLPAALVVETVQGEGGICVIPTEWLKQAREFCDEYGILLIIDDIQTGCARTGDFFSFQRAGIVPDMVTMSKSIGGIGMPFALTLFKPELDCFNPGEHNGTFRGNQLAMIAAKASLEYMLNEKVEDQVKAKEKIVSDYLHENIPAEYADIRGMGLFWGVETKSREIALAITRRCFEKGLIAERSGRNDAVIKLMPPLVIEEELLIKGLSILCESVNYVMNENK